MCSKMKCILGNTGLSQSWARQMTTVLCHYDDSCGSTILRCNQTITYSGNAATVAPGMGTQLKAREYSASPRARDRCMGQYSDHWQSCGMSLLRTASLGTRSWVLRTRPGVAVSVVDELVDLVHCVKHDAIGGCCSGNAGREASVEALDATLRKQFLSCSNHVRVLFLGCFQMVCHLG